MSLPRWLEPLLDAEQMRATDRWAIEERGVPSLELMEHAAEGLADVVRRHAPAGRVAVVCGKGNNGGDGLVVGRLLRDEGREVDVLATGDMFELKGDALANLERLPGAPLVAITSTSRNAHPPSMPIALATASFAQKRAARCMTGRARPAA